MCSRCSKITHSGGKIGWIVNLKKSELKPTKDIEFLVLLQSSRGFGLSKSKENRQTQYSGGFHFAGSDYYSKENHVSNWGHGFHGEDSSIGSNPYETFSVVSEEQLAVSPVLGQGCSNYSGDKGSSGLVDGSSELALGFESASERIQFVDVHRCMREWLGAHLNNCTKVGFGIS